MGVETLPLPVWEARHRVGEVFIQRGGPTSTRTSRVLICVLGGIKKGGRHGGSLVGLNGLWTIWQDCIGCGGSYIYSYSHLFYPSFLSSLTQAHVGLLGAPRRDPGALPTFSSSPCDRAVHLHRNDGQGRNFDGNWKCFSNSSFSAGGVFVMIDTKTGEPTRSGGIRSGVV